ncbi:hypothetical protein St703_30140 [Sporolactobacillus terrae]|uniref:Uncharacterized protein n=1 Tax=Sporolactobacillus terrae TaxID=269673 RepID=A0A5K7X2N3_9BACL|nr:hypothetical protein St703_30140 [Sporolactobacillus terrae]
MAFLAGDAQPSRKLIQATKKNTTRKFGPKRWRVKVSAIKNKKRVLPICELTKVPFKPNLFRISGAKMPLINLMTVVKKGMTVIRIADLVTT